MAAIVMKIQPLLLLFIGILQPVAASRHSSMCRAVSWGAPGGVCWASLAAAPGKKTSQAGVWVPCVRFGSLLQGWVQVGTNISAVIGSRKATSFGGLTLKPGSRFGKESAAGAGPAVSPSVRPRAIQYHSLLTGAITRFFGGGIGFQVN